VELTQYLPSHAIMHFIIMFMFMIVVTFVRRVSTEDQVMHK